MQAIKTTEIPTLEVVARGKVRDVYAYGDDALLFVVTDRVSAFDIVLEEGIPDKGKVLNQVSSFWFDWAEPIVGNHLIADDVAAFPDDLRPYHDQLMGRSSLVRKADMFPVECVARGYISGSGWKEYKRDGTVCGIRLPDGLQESDQLPEPIFTPATKAHTGHDENISFERMVSIVGQEDAETLRELTLELYRKAADAYFLAGKPGRAVANFERAAGSAMGFGDITLAAESYLNAALLSFERGDQIRANENGWKAHRLSGSTALSEEVRQAIRQHLIVGETAVALGTGILRQ